MHFDPRRILRHRHQLLRRMPIFQIAALGVPNGVVPRIAAPPHLIDLFFLVVKDALSPIVFVVVRVSVQKTIPEICHGKLLSRPRGRVAEVIIFRERHVLFPARRSIAARIALLPGIRRERAVRGSGSSSSAAREKREQQSHRRQGKFPHLIHGIPLFVKPSQDIRRPFLPRSGKNRPYCSSIPRWPLFRRRRPCNR